MGTITKTTQLVKLEHQPNIGKKLAEKLNRADITTLEQLTSIGSENAFIKLSTIDDSTCYNMLCALEGAIQGIRWHSLSADKKLELKEFYDMNRSGT